LFFSTAPEGSTELKAIAVLLRGSDELNPVKLKNALGLPQEPLMLSDKEVKEVSGAWPGSCGPVGLRIPIYMDKGVEILRNGITGANRDGFHIRNVNPGRDFTAQGVFDLRMAREGDLSPEGDGRLKSIRGIEVGHIFYLGQVYSEPMGLKFLNAEGQTQAVEMGCYGLGVTRTLQAAVEQNHDKNGIIWPLSIAPFHLHVCALDVKNEDVMSKVYEIVGALESQGVEVLVDDRDERPGFKFKDADLLGMPWRLNVGGRGLAQGVVELVERRSSEMTKVPVEDAVPRILEVLAEQGLKLQEKS
jgi:prolyl-tRNA synthetase